MSSKLKYSDEFSIESIDPKIFSTIPKDKLLHLEQKLLALKKSRTKQYIQPQKKQHFQPNEREIHQTINHTTYYTHK